MITNVYMTRYVIYKANFLIKTCVFQIMRIELIKNLDSRVYRFRRKISPSACPLWSMRWNFRRRFDYALASI